MAKGYSIHIGLNGVDPACYSGWRGALVACENDAACMEALAGPLGFKTRVLKTGEATRNAVTNTIAGTLKELVSGDMLLLTYSGHGGQLPDGNGDEDDGLDETWCLYDGELVDDELYALFAGAASGVQIVVLADCCHSGTNTKAMVLPAVEPTSGEYAVKAMPLDICLRTYKDHQAYYDGILGQPAPAASSVQATVLLLSACQDEEEARDGAFNGEFTKALLTALKKKQLNDYVALREEIERLSPSTQTPNLFVYGADSEAMQTRAPFKIGSST